MTSRQCHARNKDRQRCSQPADHEGDHYILIEWMDGDSYDPEIDAPVPFVPTLSAVVMNATDDMVRGLGVPMPADFGSGGMDDDMGGSPGTCFSCGCAEAAHPCDAHQCRSYVP